MKTNLLMEIKKGFFHTEGTLVKDAEEQVKCRLVEMGSG